jgi:hypothetical protein
LILHEKEKGKGSHHGDTEGTEKKGKRENHERHEKRSEEKGVEG